MQIEVNNAQYAKLTVVAQAAGYKDVSALMSALADEPTEDPRGPLSESELAASLEMLRESEEDIAAGRTQDMRKGLQQIAENLDIKIIQ